MQAKTRTRILIAVTSTAGLIVIIGVAFLIFVAKTALTAEEHLHATWRALDVTDQYVAVHGDWPRSWDALKGMKLEGDQGQVNIDELRECVEFDFSLQLNSVNTNDVVAFQAIKPKHPTYDAYEWQVRKLLATIAKIRGKNRGAPSS
jgi:hypothetical protein